MTRRCSYCDEEIRDSAVKCKHCGSMLNDTIGGLASDGSPSCPGSRGAAGSVPTRDWDETLDRMASLTPGSLVEGQVLAGRYRLERILGLGGMGIVWRATDSELDQVVAIKVLPDVLSRDGRAIESLKVEAKLSLKLAHANICRLTNFHSDGDIKFLIMEYLDGQTLESLLASRPEKKLTLEELQPIARQIGHALNYAHRLTAPVLHRDIKPANIMIAVDGTAKLLDFGIAREIKDSMTKVTGKYGTSGTIPYMSPEQFRGSKMTPASDIYSLAIVLYKCLAGKPYISPSGDPSYQILQRPYEPIDGQPDNINSALKAALAKDSADRPKSASAILDVSTAASPSGHKGQVRTVEPKSPSAAHSTKLSSVRKWIYGLSILLLIILLICFFPNYDRRQIPPETSASITPFDEETQVTETEAQGEAEAKRVAAAVEANRIAEEARLAKLASKKRQRIETCLAAAQSALDQKDYDSAATEVGKVFDDDPANAIAKAMRKKIEEAADLDSMERAKNVQRLALARASWEAALRRMAPEHVKHLKEFGGKPWEDVQALLKRSGKSSDMEAHIIAYKKATESLPEVSRHVQGKLNEKTAAEKAHRTCLSTKASADVVEAARDGGESYARGCSEQLRGEKALKEKQFVAAGSAFVASEREFVLATSQARTIQELRASREGYDTAWEKVTAPQKQRLNLCGKTRWASIQDLLAKAKKGENISLQARCYRQATDKLPQAIAYAEKEYRENHAPPKFHHEKLLKQHTSGIGSLAISSKGNYLATGGLQDGSVYLYDRSSLSSRKLVNREWVWKLTFAPDGKKLASTAGHNVLLWDTKTGQCVNKLTGHRDTVSAVVFSPDGRVLASVGLDKTLRVWDIGTGKEKWSTLRPEGLNNVAFSPDGQWVASSCLDRNVYIQNMETGKEIRTIGPLHAWANWIAFSRDGKVLFTCGKNNLAKWDTQTGRATSIYSFPVGHTATIAGVSASERWIAVGVVDVDIDVSRLSDLGYMIQLRDRMSRMVSRVDIIDIKTKKCVISLPAKHSNIISALAFSPDDQSLVTGSWDDTVKIWKRTKE